MKKTVLSFIAAAFIITLASCDKVAEALFKPFDTSVSFDVTINPTPAGTSGTLGSTVVNYDLNAEVSKATSGAFKGDFISQIYLSQIDVILSNTDATNNFSNFESVSLQVSTAGSTPTILGPYAVPANAVSSIQIGVSNSPNIRQYFSGANVSFSLLGKTKKAVTKQLAANINAQLSMDK